jgi:hypothetical protein
VFVIFPSLFCAISLRAGSVLAGAAVKALYLLTADLSSGASLMVLCAPTHRPRGPPATPRHATPRPAKPRERTPKSHAHTQVWPEINLPKIQKIERKPSTLVAGHFSTYSSA